MVKTKPLIEPKKLNKRKSTLSKVNNKNSKLKKKSGRPRRSRRGLKKTKRERTGVVYLSHIPHGFYEDQIEGYFGQFGKVNAVSVPRSKSGRSKGYAFIEYRYPEVAKIAAETMNNYLMFNRLLKAQYIPPEQQKPRLFRLAKEARENRKTAADKAELAVKHNRRVKNRHLKIEFQAKFAAKMLKKKNALIKRAEKLGIPHDFTIGETNLMTVFEMKKEMDDEKKKNLESGKGNDSSEESSSEIDGDSQKMDAEKKKQFRSVKDDLSEEQSSSSENDGDYQSLESDFSLHEDDEDLTESEEEDYRQIILNAKKASKDILKNSTKRSKLEKVNKSLTMSKSVQIKPRLLNAVVKSTSMGAKNKEKPRTVKMEGSPMNEETTNKKPKSSEIKGRKSQSKKIEFSLEKTPKSVKKNKLSDKTWKMEKEFNRSQVVFEVEDSGKEIVLKTPPDATKSLIKTKGHSLKKTPKDKPARMSLLTPMKENSSEKSFNENVTPEMSPRKKLRHRKLKHLSTSK